MLQSRIGLVLKETTFGVRVYRMRSWESVACTSRPLVSHSMCDLSNGNTHFRLNDPGSVNVPPTYADPSRNTQASSQVLFDINKKNAHSR
jgi:hypothetical protein